MSLLHIYDSSDARIRQTANRRGAQDELAISNVSDLRTELDKLKNTGKIFNRILFETHGDPGIIYFNHQPIDESYWKTMLGRYNSLTLPFTRIYFNGCNVGEGKEGWKFLESVVPVFMPTSHGEVFAHDSIGFANPFDGHTWHFWGKTKTLIVKGGVIVEKNET